jgi:hypothetical protein
LSPPEGIPGWVPIYPGKVEKIYNRGNAGGFNITTAHEANQTRGLYAALLRAAGYQVQTGQDGGYYAWGASESQKRSIAMIASTKGGVTTVTVMFEQN